MLMFDRLKHTESNHRALKEQSERDQYDDVMQSKPKILIYQAHDSGFYVRPTAVLKQKPNSPNPIYQV